MTSTESKLLDILLAPLCRLETYEGSLVLDQFEIETYEGSLVLDQFEINTQD